MSRTATLLQADVGNRGLSGQRSLIYVAHRVGGRLKAASWSSGHSLIENFLHATDTLVTSNGNSLGVLDRLEVFVPTARETLLVGLTRPMLSNVHRGIYGLELSQSGQVLRFSPTEMIARNLSFERALEIFHEDLVSRGIRPNREEWSISALRGNQYLIQMNPSPELIRMFRGNELVIADDVTSATVDSLTAGLAEWLVRQVHSNGRMTYKYWPSRGTESTSNNMIRQFMATLALEKWAQRSGDQATVEAAQRNIRFNVREFYSEYGTLGAIEYKGQVKLGAVALAALAIRESSSREDFAAEEASLVRTVEHLWNSETGEFRTFLRPEGRNDNQNFYPGEAMLLWAHMIFEDDDHRTLEMFMRSFAYYREWHRHNKNPAFIPWHTQANFLVWSKSGDSELRDFIFEMNDWLITTQQWDGAVYQDVKGRFYDPAFSGYGPPHASSSGIYLEGLADAYALAVACDDADRAVAYRQTIIRGLRNVMQLQFVDDIDMYYVSKRDRVRGGIRTTVYNNEVRVDNVQHNLMACMRIIDTVFANGNDADIGSTQR